MGATGTGVREPEEFDFPIPTASLPSCATSRHQKVPGFLRLITSLQSIDCDELTTRAMVDG